MSNNWSDQILDASNGGLDIIHHYYPQARPGRNFKIRDERTASASLYQHRESGVWLVTDFGDDSKPRNGILVYAVEEGLSPRDAVLQLAERYGITSQKQILKPEIRKKKPTEVEYLDEFDENNYFFEFKTEFTEAELDVLGPLVTNEVCKRYRLFSVNFYAKKTETEIVEIRSTEHFPIFAFVNTTDGKKWMKVLQPKNTKKKYRFFHIGGRPTDFVFGLDHVAKKFAALQPVDDEEYSEEFEEFKETELERVVLASGDRDALNLAGAGELVIWLNSETANFSTSLYANLKGKAKKIINVPDIDKTGREQGAALALEYMDIYTAWLPDALSERKDFRGNVKKDFLDFCNKYRHNTWALKNEVRLLLDNAKSCKFWWSFATKKGWAYDFDNVNAYYFLSMCGFYRMTDPENRDEYIFIRKKDHLVRKVNYLQVKGFVNQFIQEKQRKLGDRIIPNALRNMIYNTAKMNESSLVNLPVTELDFTDFGRHHQMMFFKNQVWKITGTAIVEFNPTDIKESVWVDDLIDVRVHRMYGHKINPKALTIDDRYFTIWKDKEGDYDIRIDHPDCEFLNYLINTSRVHWQTEELAMAGKSEEERAEYWNKNRFNIAGQGLTDDEIHEQKLHLINKIFSYGYLLHGYKDPNKSWLVWLMDNEIVDDDESHGRTGKSLYSKSLRVFMDTKVLEARNRKMFDNSFLYDGVTEYTDYLLFDDANKYFDVGQIYTKITGDFGVNPKNNKPYVIPFAKSPKMSVSTNYAIRDSSTSTSDRLLIGVFSNYYHAETATLPRRGPQDEFGHLFFNDWKDDQWVKFLNFSAQALKFFLSVNEKLSAPDENVIKRNSLTQMGVAFQNWADIYLPQFINVKMDEDKFFNKMTAYENMKETEKSLSSSSAKDFTRKLEHWCTYNEVTLDPKEKRNTKDGRIFRWEENKSQQYHFLYKENAEEVFPGLNIKYKDGSPDELDELKF